MRKDELFWWASMRPDERAEYVMLDGEIAGVNRRRKTLRDRAYQRARRDKEKIDG